MYGVVALGYEFLSEFVPFLVVLLLFRRNRGKYSTPFSKWHYLMPMVFALYIIAVFYITNPGTLYDAMGTSWEEMKERINWLPFSEKIDPVGYLLNVVMFLPFGILVPLIWKRIRKGTCLAALGFSALIEVTQLFSGRGTDVDDLIMNTLGAVIGYLAYRVWDKVMDSRFRVKGLPAGELTVFVLAIFLGRFLLFYRMGLIRLIYGY